jgi:hypothetical protein
MRLAFFLSLFIYPKDTARCGEASSPHDVIEVVIVGEKQKDPTDGLRTPVGVGVGFFWSVRTNRVFGVGTKGVERHDQLLGNFRTA